MKKYNLVKIENGKKEVVEKNIAMSVAMAHINMRKADDNLVSVYSLDCGQQFEAEKEDDFVTYQVYDAEPAWEDKLTKKPQE